jgi:hypothetical protein
MAADAPRRECPACGEAMQFDGTFPLFGPARASFFQRESQTVRFFSCRCGRTETEKSTDSGSGVRS